MKIPVKRIGNMALRRLAIALTYLPALCVMTVWWAGRAIVALGLSYRDFTRTAIDCWKHPI